MSDNARIELARHRKRQVGRLLDGVQHDVFPTSSADIAQACWQVPYKETA